VCICKDGYESHGNTLCTARIIVSECLRESDCTGVIDNSLCEGEQCACAEGEKKSKAEKNMGEIFNNNA